MINCLRNLLGEQCAVLAPTGIAVLNISGSTLHSFLHFAKVHEVNYLTGAGLLQLQEKCSMLKYILVDELSMIGCHLIRAVDFRLRQAFPTKADEFFGGCSIVMFGDFGQLSPVGDASMFKPNLNNANSIQGHAAYRQFTSVYRLTQCIRQANDIPFHNLLLRLRNAQITNDDYILLSQRFIGLQQDPLFDNAVRLFPTRQLVHEYNLSKLLALPNPHVIIDSIHNNAEARKFDANIACGLEKTVSIAVGAKIMLRINLWVKKGLVNGSIGTVLRIIYNQNTPPSLPAFVVCIFPSYTGPPSLPDHPNSFPIIPVQRQWSIGNQTYSRIGIPLDLAWALTIHKSQGLTLDNAVIDLGQQETSAGLSFVALSRVRRLDNLLLTPFPFDRLNGLSNHNQFINRRAEEDRLDGV